MWKFKLIMCRWKGISFGIFCKKYKAIFMEILPECLMRQFCLEINLALLSQYEYIYYRSRYELMAIVIITNNR